MHDSGKLAWIALAVALALSACGQWRMVDTDTRMQEHARAGHYDQALALLRAEKHQSFKPEDRVMYWMNEGMLLHLVGDHRASIEALTLAENRSRELFTQSVSKYVKAAFTSDGALDYQGEDYEKVLLNVIKALDFLALGETEGALVEARKINRKLEYMNTMYQEHPNRYAEDGFAHWLMGMLFEMEGSYDDARIAFQHARRVYRDHFQPRYGVPEPSYLAEDLARAALRGGELELLEELRTEFADPGLGRSDAALASHGEIVLVHLNGAGPTKTDLVVQCASLQGQPWTCDHQPGGEYMVERAYSPPNGSTRFSAAFPRLVTSQPRKTHIVLSSSADGARSMSQVAMPIDRIAAETLADKLPRVFQKAVLRALTRAGTRKAANKTGDTLESKGTAGAVLGFLVSSGTDLALDLSEEADKRTWSTLPARIEVARIRVPEGIHDIAVTAPDNTLVTVFRDIEVRPGQRIFLTHRSIP